MNDVAALHSSYISLHCTAPIFFQSLLFTPNPTPHIHMSYQPPPGNYDLAAKQDESTPMPTPLGMVEGVPIAMAGTMDAPFGALHSAGTGMPPPMPQSTLITGNISNRTVAFGRAENIDFTDCELREVHLVGGYVRNCRVFGGAFEDCTFKSCALHNVHHCYESKLDDCSIEQRDTTVLVECNLIHCETGSADLRDCKVKR